jgi:hypothetical protein
MLMEGFSLLVMAALLTGLSSRVLLYARLTVIHWLVSSTQVSRPLYLGRAETDVFNFVGECCKRRQVIAYQ